MQDVRDVPALADAAVRVQRFTQGSDFSAVAELLRVRRNEILRRWLSAVGLQPFLRGEGERDTADHIPELYDALTDLLRRRAPRAVDAEAPLDDPAVLHAAEAHARERLRQGLSAVDVVTEFRLLRQEIGRALHLAVAEHDHEAPLDVVAASDVVAAELLVHDALDGAVAIALDAIARRAEETRAQLSNALDSERAAAAAAATAHEWADFLAEAGALLAESLEGEPTLARVAQLVVPRLADWCTVYVVGEDGEPRRLAAAHADPRKDALMRALLRFPLSPNPQHPVRRAIRTREPVLAPAATAETADRYATDDTHARLIREVGTGAALIVPLIARGDAVGAISAGRSGVAGAPSRAPDDAGVDTALLTEIARRAALALDNARLYREAQQALQVRDEVLAAVSHDLRTPLAAISGQAQLIERDAQRGDAPDPARQARRAAMIVNGARRMTAMVDELLDVARLRAGQRLELQSEPIDLVAIARRVVADQQRQAHAHTIVVAAQSEEIVGEWDAQRVERVLANLVGNAVKYSPLGGEVRVALSQEDQNVVIVVQDEGVGIAAEDLRRIFEPFQRAKQAGGRIAGQGVGLASARQIVEAHGGTIGAQSVPGQGSTFTVTLPLHPPAEGAP